MCVSPQKVSAAASAVITTIIITVIYGRIDSFQHSQLCTGTIPKAGSPWVEMKGPASALSVSRTRALYNCHAGPCASRKTALELIRRQKQCRLKQCLALRCGRSGADSFPRPNYYRGYHLHLRKQEWNETDTRSNPSSTLRSSGRGPMAEPL